jgi:LysM repeat protein
MAIATVSPRPELARTKWAPDETALEPLRLTRRGRLALALLAMVAAVLTGVAIAGPVVADPPGVQPTTRTVVVSPGDTLWEIARTVAPDRDPRSTVGEIRRLNGTDGADLAVGDVLIVPVR